jgi:hypothetical protein
MRARDYPRFLVRAYVLLLVVGFVAGLKFDLGVGFHIEASNELVWTLAGTLSGMLYLGLGPVIALFFLGVHNGELIDAYLASEGGLIRESAVDPQLANGMLEICRSSMETLAFLYGAVGGMYLSMYYLEVYNSGFAMDEAPKKNFIRKFAESLLLASIAFGLRLVSF